MSVTGHRDVRQPDDSYATPEWCTRLLLPYLQRGDVLDPCCGAGAIAKPVFEAWGGPHDVYLSIDGIELDDSRVNAALEAGYFDQVVQNDYLTRPKGRHYPLIITNPPFSLAMPFLEKAMQEADTVAFLLRLAWLAGVERSTFHQQHPCDVVVLPRRPSFAKYVSCADTSIDPDFKPVPPDYEIPLKCGWHEAMPPGTPKPKKCPQCGAKTKATSSDSADYGWFVWGPGRGGRIIHPAIDVAQVHVQFAGAAAELEELTR